MEYSDIKATLKHERFYSLKTMRAMKICLAVTLGIAFVFIICIITFMGMKVIDRGEILPISLSCLLAFIPAIVVAVCMGIARRQKKEIESWLIDAVLVYAKITRTYSLDVGCEYQICVSFRFNGKRLHLISRPHCFDRFGGTRVLTSYVGNCVKVLYSPSYHEIMLLEKPNPLQKRRIK